MVLKKPSQQKISPIVTPEQADTLADQLADKPYGHKNPIPMKVSESEITRTTISLPKELLEIIEDMAITNKRKGIEPKNVSAIIRYALDAYLGHKKR